MKPPYANAEELTRTFMDYCAINALRLALSNFEPEDQSRIKEAIVTRWKNDSNNLFEHQKILMKEASKNVKPQDKIVFLNALDDLEKQYEADFKAAEAAVLNLLNHERQENKDIIIGG